MTNRRRPDAPYCCFHEPRTRFDLARQFWYTEHVSAVRHLWNGSGVHFPDVTPPIFGCFARDTGDSFMASGKVKWWDNKKGFGFISQEDGKDVFVHHKGILGKGFKVLREGEEVTFDVVTSEKGLKAENVQRRAIAP